MACRIAWLKTSNCPGLLLAHSQHAVTNVLASHPHHIGAPLPSVEQERECQPCARSDRVTPLELGNLGIAPAMKTVRLHADRAHVPGRIVSSKADLDRVLHHGP